MTCAQLVKRRRRLDSCGHYVFDVGKLKVSGDVERITLSAAPLIPGPWGIGASGESTTSKSKEKT